MKYVVKTTTLSALLSVSALLSGCATVVSGTDQSIQVDSTPSNAIVMLNGNQRGTTPLKLNIQRNAKNATVQLNLQGFESKEITLKKTTNGWIWGNILLGGIIGVAVDAATGAMYSFELPDQGALAEVPASGKQAPEDVDIWINVVMKPKATWSKIDQMIPVS